ncbi:MAG TPA: acyl-CoA dehydrogenase family protein [Pirellulales bacterium]|nr:acyl-CoA dehydrogenase family protein [Pirellulales bacterium]
MNQTDRDRQLAEAEEVLADRPASIGFAKGLFFGRYLGDALPAYPDLEADPRASRAVADLAAFCRQEVDPVAIDRQAEIPDSVVRGLGWLGVLGACLPKEFGGGGFSQVSYCRMIEVLGGHCGSTALFVNAHHSIGPRALVLFGTAAQQAKYLPKLSSGQWLSAFALTEPQAGSDAANVQTTATPTPDGSGYVLNGEKRWITNGAIAQVLTVMARTPVAGSDQTKITAFVVTPDMPGFEVVEARMPKCGVRGTATARLAFHDMFVPRENVLGSLGKGLRVALTVLDFGRTTFGASCTGAAKFCLERASRHALARVQFRQPLAQFEMVKEKIAYMAAGAFAMEAATFQTAALIDSGEGDYMLETALLKVFSTEVLWQIVNDCIQIFGGKAYFTDEPYERLMRDARINTIGEGANDVLRAFVALVGMRDVGLELQGVLEAAKTPWRNLGRLSSFAGHRIEALFAAPAVSVLHGELEPDARRLGKLVGLLGSQIERLLAHYQEGIIDRQYQQGRVADSVIEIYTSACVLRRLDALRSQSNLSPADWTTALTTGRYYLRTAERRIRHNLGDLWSNDDALTTELADLVLHRQREKTGDTEA